MQISIHLSASQYQLIARLAAKREMSIELFVLERALALTAEEQAAMEELKAYLAPRLAEAERGEFYEGTMDDILAEIHAEQGCSHLHED